MIKKDEVLRIASSLSEYGFVDVDEVAYEYAAQEGLLRQARPGQYLIVPSGLNAEVEAVLAEEW